MVRDVRFQAERGDARRLPVGVVETDPAEELVGRVIEDHQVVAHVHVPVVIDPLRAHDVTVDVERRGDGHQPSGFLLGATPLSDASTSNTTPKSKWPRPKPRAIVSHSCANAVVGNGTPTAWP